MVVRRVAALSRRLPPGLMSIPQRDNYPDTGGSRRDNPVWIAKKIMGHRDAEMVIKVYSGYVENLQGSEEGSTLDAVFRRVEDVKKSKQG